MADESTDTKLQVHLRLDPDVVVMLERVRQSLDHSWATPTLTDAARKALKRGLEEMLAEMDGGK